ncbi:BamA/TamA family outer membrane protein [Nitritalea halalkaliphila]|uniref:hypothetical protein n=1 Tax=Nitritalea halalkaliphila TaxID=590849 RepID=UPI00067FB511|nr:hypothetical protein [Nitritalea halalkaliphila]
MQLAQAKQLNERMNAAEAAGSQRRTSRAQEEEEVSETELIVLPERAAVESATETAVSELVTEESEEEQVETESVLEAEEEEQTEELITRIQEELAVIAEQVESITVEEASTEETMEGESQALRRTERESIASDTTRRAATTPPAGVNLEELLIGAPSRAGTPRAAATQGAAQQGAASQVGAQAGEGPAQQGGVLDQFRRMQSPSFERLPEVTLGEATDTVPPRTGGSGRIDTQGLRFEGRGGIDYENYTFDTIPALQDFQQEPRRNLAGRNALLENFRRQGLQRRITGPRRITPQFMTSSFRTNFVIDPLRGFGIALNGEMNDLLDNHRVRGGIMAALDFRSGSDVFFDYEYLKRRLDFRFRYDRSALQVSEGETFQRYVLNKAELGVSYPLNVHSRLTLAPFYANTQYFNLNPDSLLRATDRDANSLMVNYAGARAEFVVDKTTQLGLYMQQGFKAKAGFAHFQGLNAADRSFSNFYLDVRNYQKVVKNITFASRLFVGSFFGNNPQTYLVGGMDNWVFNRFSQPPANRNEPSPVRNPTGVENSNILFAEFVDLRGYDLDEIRGNNVITFTSEIRVPIFSFLSRGNLTSNFLRNFQMVGFYDIGSAWNEAAPWERVNDQNTEVIRTPASPFTITLNNFNNPWLQSYGAGIRTVLLNYYVKMDVARPIRNNQPENLRLYVTLGYNF